VIDVVLQPQLQHRHVPEQIAAAGGQGGIRMLQHPLHDAVVEEPSGPGLGRVQHLTDALEHRAGEVAELGDGEIALLAVDDLTGEHLARERLEHALATVDRLELRRA